jgi:hypothetical protein
MDEMDHKGDDYWGSLLLAMAWDARQEGDFVTAELLRDEAMRYFDEGDRLASDRFAPVTANARSWPDLMYPIDEVGTSKSPAPVQPEDRSVRAPSRDRARGSSALRS